MSSIERTMTILDILATEPDGVRITDVATRLGLNRAIPHRILAELVALGYVVQDPRTERYRATFKLGSLGVRQLETAGTVRWAQDQLDALAARTRELVRLAIVVDGGLRWIAKAQGAATALIFDGVSGSDVVLHATASGKAWLSTLPEPDVEAILGERGLSAQTERTETDLQHLLSEISSAREQGYAVTQEEMEIGVSAIAVPVVPSETGDGRGVATVSVAGPAARLRPDMMVSFAPALQQAASHLARQWHAYEYLAALTSRLDGAGQKRRA